MSVLVENGEGVFEGSARCADSREKFSAYLDGALDGRTMTALAAHLNSCEACGSEFEAWRSMQTALGELGPAQVPVELQARLRDALASEIVTMRHLSPWQRAMDFCQQTLAPAGLRLGAGFAATLMILGSAAWVLGSAMPVQANDDQMAHLHAPRFLYSQATTQPITTGKGKAFVAVMVDAKVDARGRVYDFDVIDGPNDPATRLRIEDNLLGSVFQPATVFGVPVPGHAMMTYTTVSAAS